MGKIKLLNTNNNSYFENNQIDISDSIPTEGNHIVGDIVIKETQVEHMAIGWICIEAGNPGVWAEFGGMFENDEPIVLDPESVGMNELNSEVKSKLLLGDSIVINVQALQSAVANCATKDDLKNIDLSLYATKEDLENIDLSLYATKEELNNIDLSGKQDTIDNNLATTDKTIVGAINEITGNTNYVRDTLGNADELLTNNKTTVVAAINEVFQSGVNVKQNLVDALIAKNIDCSTSNSFDELISMINEIRYSPFVDWAKANTWLVTGTCTAMPATSYYLTAEAYKSKIYCIGGYGTTTATRVYDTKTNSWATLANVPTGIYGHGSTIIGDKIYCIGGYNKIAKNQVYDITNNNWSPLTDMTTARMYHSTDAVGTNIYCIGGNGSTTYLKTNECYDTITNTWSSKTDMTVAKYAHGSAVIGNNIYCIGGYTGSFVKTNYCYDTITNTWTTKTAISANRRYVSCVTVDDKIYAMCGQSASSTYQKTNYCYDPITNTWTTMTACVGTASYGKGAAAVNGMIFLFGGYSGSALKTVECYIV